MTRSYKGRDQKLSQLLDGEIVRETDKAFQIDVTWSGIDGELRGRKLWFPKSQVVVEDGKVFVADWILNQKASEIPHCLGIETI